MSRGRWYCATSCRRPSATPSRSRCSRGWRRAQARAVQADGRGAAAVRTDRGDGRDRRQHRLPGPAARREHRPGELPAGAVHDHRGLGRVRRQARRFRARGRRHATRSTLRPAAGPWRGPPRHAGRRGPGRRATASAPEPVEFVNEPDADPTAAEVRQRIGDACRPPQSPSRRWSTRSPAIDAAVARVFGAGAAWAAAGARRPQGRAPRRRRPPCSRAVRHARGDGARGGQDGARGRPRGDARRSTSPATTPPSGTTPSPSRPARAPSWHRSAWWSSPRRGTSPTRSPPAGCWRRWRQATPSCSSRRRETRRTARGWPTQLWRGRGAARRAAVRRLVPTTTSGRRLITHERVATVVLTGGLRDRHAVPSVGSPTLRLLRRDQRQERDRHHRRRPTSTRRSVTWSAPPSATPARSAPPPAWRSSKAALYDDPKFLARLADAVTSLSRRPGRRPGHDGRALVDPPAAKLTRGVDRARRQASGGWSSPANSTTRRVVAGRAASACGPARGSTRPSVSGRSWG